MSAGPEWEEVTRLVAGKAIPLGGNRVVIGTVRMRRERGYRHGADILVSGVMNESVAVEIRFRDVKAPLRVEVTE